MPFCIVFDGKKPKRTPLVSNVLRALIKDEVLYKALPKSLKMAKTILK